MKLVWFSSCLSGNRKEHERRLTAFDETEIASGQTDS